MENVFCKKFLFVFFLSIAFGRCCEEWQIDSEALDIKSIFFKSSTLVTKNEKFSWSWLVPGKAIWKTSLFRAFDTGILAGGFVLNQLSKPGSDLITLNWRQTNGKITWVIRGNPEFSLLAWKLNMSNGLHWGFSPAGVDKWQFNFGDFIIPSILTQTPSTENLTLYNSINLEGRFKRSEDFDQPPTVEEEMPDQNQIKNCTFKKHWFNKIVDFFFSEGNEARGEKPGIFTQVGKWMRKIACRINGPCEGETPTPDFPTSSEMPHEQFPPSPTQPDEILPDEATENILDEMKQSNDV
ncbi:uncharacterized protein LOC106668045 [Cimex lectularius]|uniref:Uncharacterized protein n=1 Tax=Cimex lectularius TaxID=79782 RepID=A0A8I6S1Z0_CIMLE|nr:uncharacterized protein LOC106668045 [Cimex lectularius]